MKKIALITGAGTGLGRAIAISLSQNGFTVALNGRREEKLQEVEKEIKDSEVIIVPGDVTDKNSVAEIKKSLLEKTDGKLDLLVNNVGGVSVIAPITDMSLEQWQDMMDKNLTSQFLMTKAFLPALRKSERGKIVSVTSGMAHFFMDGFAAYSASKAGVESLMKAVAEEEKENGIEVHLFDPENVVSESNPDGEKDPMEMAQKLMKTIK